MGDYRAMIPPAKHGGRKRTTDVREILNGIFYVLSRPVVCCFPREQCYRPMITGSN
jgi:hypothetical protein